MNRLLVLAVGASILFASCGRSSETSSTTSGDSTTMPDQPMTSTSDTMHGGHTNSSNIMAIMDKSMRDMKAMKSIGNADVDFAATMKLHHMSAIEASQLVLQQGTDSTIKAMAQKMLTDQQKEVDAFDAYLARTSLQGTDTMFFVKSMEAMNKMNMDMDHSGSIDKQFVVMMIPHHQGAVDMSQLYLKSGSDTEMKKMANNIIASQKKEIKELKSWLAAQK